MSRPSQDLAKLINVRNDLIIQCVESGELNQSEVATIFRLPRNTVSVVVRKKKNEHKRLPTN
jgi:predicted XRE-type DNA-binding protein